MNEKDNHGACGEYDKEFGHIIDQTRALAMDIQVYLSFGKILVGPRVTFSTSLGNIGFIHCGSGIGRGINVVNAVTTGAIGSP